MTFNLSESQRKEILTTVTSELESVYNNPDEVIVSPKMEVGHIRKTAAAFGFDQSNDPKEVMLHVIEGIKKYSVNITHPSYFGLFNPRPNFPSVMADVINSYLNPQLAAWSHSPFAVEIEQLVIKEFGKKFGYTADAIDGVFCIGGTESNLTAVLAALEEKIPGIAEDGLLKLEKQPLIYGSTESHHSMERAARTVGLGTKAVKKIPVKENLIMDCAALRSQIVIDIQNGHKPFMVVGTAGTTGVGAFDDLEEIAKICKEFDLWFHVDAAYGGGAIVTDLKHLLKGIDKSDSITLDLHKWFSVPMATSIFLTSKPKILNNTFNVRTNYMPEDGDPNKVFDPYVNSLQWSRRFIGLKIYLPLAIFGWEGYNKMITHQIEMGNTLRKLLIEDGWIIKNNTEVPIVCFTHPEIEGNNHLVQRIVDKAVASGETWITTYPINGTLNLRAQVANYDTQMKDLHKLIHTLTVCKNKIALSLEKQIG